MTFPDIIDYQVALSGGGLLLSMLDIWLAAHRNTLQVEEGDSKVVLFFFQACFHIHLH